MLLNSALERLSRNEVSIGVGLRQARTVDIAKIMKTAGFDWLFIDLEHNSMSVDIAVQIAVAALDTGIAPLARVPTMDLNLATRFLDGGGLGIVMPHVDTADEARAIVDRLKYPPIGHRSTTGALPHFDFAPPADGYAEATLNAATMITVMIETPQAVENADAIAAVDGVDALLIGSSDLTAEMGIHRQMEHERVVAAFETVIAACRNHGKHVGLGGIGPEEAISRYIGIGVRMVLAGIDTNFMLTAARRRAEFVRSCL